MFKLHCDTDLFAILRRAISTHGEGRQWNQLIEECAELIVEVRHRDRGRNTPADVAGEVADVLITALQAREILGPDMVDAIMETKLARLSRHLDTEIARRGAGLPPEGWRERYGVFPDAEAEQKHPPPSTTIHCRRCGGGIIRAFRERVCSSCGLEYDE